MEQTIEYKKTYREYKAELDGELQRTAEGFVRIGYWRRVWFFRLLPDFISLCIYYFQMFFSGQKLKDYLGKLIAAGVAAMFMFQVFTNISVVTLMFPNTGLPLPFISNGLSSMLSSMIAIGLIMNVSIQPGKTSKGGFSMRNIYGNDPVSSIDLDMDLEL